MNTVYFDHAATTPLDEDVFKAMEPYFTRQYGNANSAHQLGNNAKVEVEEAREVIAEIIGAQPAEIVFTSGGTESDNTAIKGSLQATDKTEIVTSVLEHHAVLHAVESLKRDDIKPVYLNPDEDGIIPAKRVEKAITDDTALVSLMHVNNEIGTINPITDIAQICKEQGVPFHSDTVQSIGKLPIDVEKMGLDFLSISAHKLYGPKGVGALYIRHGTPWIPWMHGGSQERRRRGGTLNVPGIIGLTEAMKRAADEMNVLNDHFNKLRNQLLKGLERKFSGLYQLNSPADKCVPNIINISFFDELKNGTDGEMLLLNLDMEGICVSNGSACTSGAVEPSHVLEGIGLNEDIANSSIRISLGKHNTSDDIDFLLEKLEVVLKRMLGAVHHE